MPNNVKLKANVWMEISSVVKHQDINSNQSTINVKVKLSNPYGSYTYAGDGPSWRIKYVIKNGDVILLDTGYITFNYLIGTTYPIDKDFILSHNSDGTPKSNIFSVFVIGESSQGLVSTSGHNADTTISIPTIPRASTVTLSGDTIGSAMTMTIIRASSSFIHKAWYRLPGQTWQVISNNATTSASFTIPISSCVYIPDSVTDKLEIELHTFNGGNLVGKTIRSFTVKVPTSEVPTVSATVGQLNSAIQNQFQAFVQDKSEAVFTITASGVHGSTIKSIVTTLLDKNYSGSSVTSDILSKSGNHQAVIKVIDSRGRTATITKTIAVVSYSSPKINSFKVERCNQDGTLNVSGSYAKAVFNSQIVAVNNKNTKSHTVRYRRKGTSAWTNLTQNTTAYATNSSAIASGVGLQHGFEFEFTVSDWFTSTSYLVSVPSGFFPLTWSTDGTFKIGIGKVAEFPGIDFREIPKINGKSFFEGEPIVAGSNLNNYLTPGIYYCPLNDTAVTLSNCPTHYAFNLEILRHANQSVRQICRIYKSGEPRTYERNFYSNAWGEWFELLTAYNMKDYVIEQTPIVTRYKSGRMVQMVKITRTISFKQSDGSDRLWGNVYISDSIMAPTLPVAFVGDYSVHSSVDCRSIWHAILVIPKISQTNCGGVALYRPVATTGTYPVTVVFKCEGRWK